MREITVGCGFVPGYEIDAVSLKNLLLKTACIIIFHEIVVFRLTYLLSSLTFPTKCSQMQSVVLHQLTNFLLIMRIVIYFLCILAIILFTRCSKDEVISPSANSPISKVEGTRSGKPVKYPNYNTSTLSPNQTGMSSNVTDTRSFEFTLATPQVVSIGFLGNLASAPRGNYFRVSAIRLFRY